MYEKSTPANAMGGYFVKGNLSWRPTCTAWRFSSKSDYFRHLFSSQFANCVVNFFGRNFLIKSYHWSQDIDTLYLDNTFFFERCNFRSR
jgi:hypothetical protein